MIDEVRHASEKSSLSFDDFMVFLSFDFFQFLWELKCSHCSEFLKNNPIMLLRYRKSDSAPAAVTKTSLLDDSRTEAK